MIGNKIKQIIALIVMLAFIPVANAAEIYKEGVDYDKIDTPVLTSNPDKIEVMEFFWYGCGHCFKMESYLDPWLARMPADVIFTRRPGVLNKSWEVHGRGYFVAQSQNLLEKTHHALFNAIHLDKKNIRTKEALADFYADYDLDREKFLKMYDSFSVSSDIRESAAMARAFRIGGVPTIIVNGKYVTSGKKARSYDRWMDIIDYLVELERQEKAAKDASAS